MTKQFLVGVLGVLLASPVVAQGTIMRRSPSFRNLPSATPPSSTTISQRFTLSPGQRLVTRYAGKETLYISTGQTLAAELVVAQPVVAENGTTLIPTGAIVRGEFVPAPGGSRFIAKELTTRGVTVTLGAESELINDVKDPRETTTGSIVGDAALGAAAAAILAGITGDRAIATEEVLAGAAAGVIIGNVTAPQVVVIPPDSIVNLTTTRNLVFGTP
ncbi:MAG: hypothetical protein RMK91_09260 [Pseudanabaenaceae cyanobacterium SKYGB_i_bin29]|nr:hypothetical protein [Pseudanabaenaceae cyanobacterium SKYG29]MDW8422043.1 hypothetical protein [Pseudanabaenaceae cyanobacterium SKYGB_i_bin29]